jgi:cytochrome c
VILLFPVAALAADDAARGERTFQRCYSCHSVDPNETAKLQGPSLYRIMGRPAAAVPGRSRRISLATDRTTPPKR